MKRGLYPAPFDELARGQMGRAVPEADAHPREAAGAAWVPTGIDPQPPQPEVRAVVDVGP